MSTERASISIHEKPTNREILRTIPFALRLIYEADTRGAVLWVVNQVMMAPLGAVSVIGLKAFTDALTRSDLRSAVLWAGCLVAAGLGTVVTSYLDERQSDRMRYAVEIAAERKQLMHMSRLPFSVLEDPTFQALSSMYGRRSYAFTNVAQAIGRILRSVFSLIGMGSVFFIFPLR